MQYNKRWFLVLFCYLLAACQGRLAQGTPTGQTPLALLTTPAPSRSATATATRTVTPAEPTPSPEPSATGTPSPTPTPMPTITLPPAVDLPAILYIEGPADGDQKLVRQNGADIQEVASLGEIGWPKDALRIGQTVLVLTDASLLVVDLQDGQVETVEGLPPAYLMGALIASPNQERVIVSLGFGTQPSDGGVLLAYDPANRTVETLATLDDFFPPYTSFLRPVGLTDDHLLYVIPHGGDVFFIDLLRIDLNTLQYEIVETGHSEFDAAVSPDGRFLVTQGAELSSDPMVNPMIRGIRLIPLSSEPQPGQWIELPFYPSRLVGLVWSRDSRCVYFSLDGLDPSQSDTSDTSYGVWKLDVDSLELSPVAENERVWSHPVTLSEDGQWLVLRPDAAPGFVVVDLSSGETATIPWPEHGAWLVRFQ